MLKALAGVRANELEQALLLLPYTDALRLLTYLCHWLRKGLQVRWVMGFAYSWYVTLFYPRLFYVTAYTPQAAQRALHA